MMITEIKIPYTIYYNNNIIVLAEHVFGTCVPTRGAEGGKTHTTQTDVNFTRAILCQSLQKKHYIP